MKKKMITKKTKNLKLKRMTMNQSRLRHEETKKNKDDRHIGKWTPKTLVGEREGTERVTTY